jgi:hypothetical protein
MDGGTPLGKAVKTAWLAADEEILQPDRKISPILRDAAWAGSWLSAVIAVTAADALSRL